MSETTSRQAAVWREVIAATAYVADVERPGFTVWHSLDEAVRWWIFDRVSVEGDVDVGVDLPWDDPDPLRTTLTSLLETVPSSGAIDGCELSMLLDSALRTWLVRTADRLNDGHPFSFSVF
ncbi:hypothetical protein [Ilumatobacter nonamiensis]|uniref:hypothetical protein n=1 Tax=Ilumatobacter nonamiensis TaxID=467093 RepID=UPI00034721AC|nr:hypothetical protein [Ilumatobacter nonamiensis]